MSLKFFQQILPMSQRMVVFDDKADVHLYCVKEYLDNLKDDAVEVESIASPSPDVNRDKIDATKSESEKVSTAICTTCCITFDNFEAQREHFKLDWHRYNVRQKSLGRQTSTEETFEEQISGELSSISGSDTEDDEEEFHASFVNTYRRELSEEEKQMSQRSLFYQHPTKSFYVTEDHILISFFKNVVHSEAQAVVRNCNIGFNLSTQLKTSLTWIYLMLSAGHFAGAVFERTKVIAHKTFHRYTVRAKRGTIQSVQDKKQGNSKSAGASIRRYNEAALAHDIQALIESWSGYIKKADKIFFKCSKYHMNILFGPKSVLSKDDTRISKISIQTKRPTFKEVQRIHLLYSTFDIYGLISNIERRIKEQLRSTTNQKDIFSKNKEFNKNIDDVPRPSDELVNAPTTDSNDSDSKGGEGGDSKSGDSRGGDESKHSNKNTRKKKSKGKNKKEMGEDGRLPEREIDENEQIWNEIYKLLKIKEYDTIKSFLSPPCASHMIHGIDNVKENLNPENCEAGLVSDNTNVDKHIDTAAKNCLLSSVDCKRKRLYFLERNYLNFCSPTYNETLLHVVVSLNNREMLRWLLELGADPSVTNNQGKFPYDAATEKDTRNEFRRFMAKHPEKYDYKTAKIPSPLTEEQEAEQRKKMSEKKKQQQKARKERLKSKKASEQQEKQAEKERKAFEALSDREKRAAMAERRFAAQLTTSLRCSNCRNAMDEKKAFERYEFKYCSTNCVQAHKTIIGK